MQLWNKLPLAEMRGLELILPTTVDFALGLVNFVLQNPQDCDASKKVPQVVMYLN